MTNRGVSRRDFEEYVRGVDERATRDGSRLSEGISRVLRKLVWANRRRGLQLHRTYEKLGETVTLSGLISDGDLVRRGYMPSDHDSFATAADDPVTRDYVTRWTSESDRVAALWVGERLTG
jgi:hypothetical protein